MISANYLKGRIASLQHLLPSEVEIALMCWRRLMLWRKHNLIFIHIPKAAGTSVARALYGRSTGHMRAEQVQRYVPRTFKSSITFAITRNPWDRAFSAYRFVRLGGTRDAGVRNLGGYANPAFRSFSAFVFEWLSAKNLNSLDYVFQPQYRFVCDSNMKVIIDFIGRMEELEKTSDFLKKTIGRTISFPHLNTLSEPQSYRAGYECSQVINAVGDLYSTDVSLFNYDF